MSFTPILPKRAANTWARLGKVGWSCYHRMKTFTHDCVLKAADYEVPGVPSYTRTDMLKDSWSEELQEDKGALIGIVKSSGKIAPYNKYIRGVKTQVKWAERRGWKNIKTILYEEWPAAKADFEKILLKTAR